MTKSESYDIFRGLIKGRRLSFDGPVKYLNELTRKGQNIIGDMPTLCYDYIAKYDKGDDLFFSLGLIHLLKQHGVKEVGLVAYDLTLKEMEEWRYAAVYKDGHGYLQFAMPEIAIEAGFIGQYFGMTKQSFKNELLDLGICGDACYLNPYGKNKDKKFEAENVKETVFSL